MTTIEPAERLKTQIENVLGDLVDLVTLDGTGVKPQTRAAVVIFAPEVTFTTFDEVELVWTFAAVAGPARDPLAAWTQLDKILTRLHQSGLNIDTASPGTFGLAGNGNMPAYEITLNPLDD